MVKNYLEVLYDNETLPAEHIVLRKFKKTDADDIYEYGSNEETLRYLVWEGLKAPEEALDAIVNIYWSKPGIYAIELKESGKCIGCLDLRVHSEHDKLSFGYVLNPNYWGKGYMTEALSAVMELSFEKLDLNRVESTHYVGNEGSGRVMEKCGMIKEGIGRQEIKIKGVFHDVVHYGIIKESYFSGR